jgi:8-oxo-dGTP diphosphatase
LILLVRHALALPRGDWDGDDAKRPLARRGVRQADGLVDLLAPYDVERIVASPTARCRTTVAPLAKARGLKVKTSKLLREGHGADGVDLLLDSVGDTVLCTHGDVVEVALREFRRLGWPVPPGSRRAKGSVWLLRREGPCEYLPPPG